MSPLPELETHPVLDPKLGLIFKSRPATADDLTALKGISRVLEKPYLMVKTNYNQLSATQIQTQASCSQSFSRFTDRLRSGRTI